MIDKILELIKSGILTQFLITSTIIITACIQILTKGSLDNDSRWLVAAIIGFYFRDVAQFTVNRIRNGR